MPRQYTAVFHATAGKPEYRAPIAYETSYPDRHGNNVNIGITHMPEGNSRVVFYADDGRLAMRNGCEYDHYIRQVVPGPMEVNRG